MKERRGEREGETRTNNGCSEKRQRCRCPAPAAGNEGPVESFCRLHSLRFVAAVSLTAVCG